MKFLVSNKHLVLSIIFMLVPVLGFASGREGGVGGPGGFGGIKRDGTVQTFAESGLLNYKRIMEKVEKTTTKFHSYYEVSLEQEKAIKNLAGKIDTGIQGSKLYAISILDERGTYIEASKDGDPSILKKITSDYRKVVASYNLNLPEEFFVVVAYSKRTENYRAKTYIFTDDFNSLRPEIQTLVFFHEFSMRTMLAHGYESDKALEKALRIDAILWEISQGDESEQKKLALYEEMAPLFTFPNEIELNSIRLRALENLMGRPIFAGELALKTSSIWSFAEPIDPALVEKNFGNIIPELATNWEKERIYTVSAADSISADEPLLERLNSLCARKKEFLKNIKIRPDYAGFMIHFDEDQNLFFAFDCPDIEGVKLNSRHLYVLRFRPK